MEHDSLTQSFGVSNYCCDSTEEMVDPQAPDIHKHHGRAGRMQDDADQHEKEDFS